MKKLFSCVMVGALLLTSALGLTACKNKNDPDGGGENNTPDNVAYVSLDINPGLELIVDKDNKVVSIHGENEDGLVLLYEESGIEGEKIDTAINKIIELAVEYGYLDETNQVVDTLITSNNNNFANNILSKINTTISAKAQNLGVNITTDSQGSYSLLRKLDELKAQFPNNTAIQNISVSKFKLALAVSEKKGVSLDVAAVLEDEELIKMLKDVNSEIEKFATTEYLEKKAEALAVFDKAAKIPAYEVYTSYYLSHLTSHPFTAYYGAAYQMYASAATAFDVVNDVIKLKANIYNYELNESDISGILTALGMDQNGIENIKNSQGKITIDSIEAYADKLFKNTPASETLNQTKTALTTALNNLESSLETEIQNIVNEYKTQVETALSTAEQVLTTVKSSMNTLPDNIQTIFNELTQDLEDILTATNEIIVENTVNAEKLNELTTKLNQKSNEYLNKIKTDLSAEEYSTLLSQFEAKVAEKDTEKQTLETALDNAAAEAKNHLAGLKDVLKNA